MHRENRIRLFSKLFVLINVLMLSTFLPISGEQVSTDSIQDIKNKISISKSVSKNKISTNESAIISILIKNDNNFEIKDVVITDSVPNIFYTYPINTFPNNDVKMNLSNIKETYIITYGITPKQNQNFDNQIISLPSALLQYKIEKDNQTINDIKSSNGVDLRIESIKKDWIETNWQWYVIILLAIAGISGLFGGIINHIIGYRVFLESIKRKTTLKSSDGKFEFDIYYIDNIPIGETTTVFINDKSLNEIRSIDQQITGSLYYGEEPSNQTSTVTGAGQIQFIIEKDNANIRIWLNDYREEILKIPLKIGGKKRGLKENALAGVASGFVVLLALLVASSFVTNHNYPANVQSIITLIVSSIISGFIPFQILDRATGQLAGKIEIIPTNSNTHLRYLRHMKQSLLDSKKIIGQGFLPIEGTSVIDINNLSPQVKKFLDID